MTNRTLFAAALVALAACGRGGGGEARTQPAGTQPAPTAQHQAAPQTGPNTPQANDAEPTAPAAAQKPRTYAECMSMPVTVSEAERERACMNLPDAPK
jgi:glucose/arabinose dehydrogenase